MPTTIPIPAAGRIGARAGPRHDPSGPGLVPRGTRPGGPGSARGLTRAGRRCRTVRNMDKQRDRWSWGRPFGRPGAVLPLTGLNAFVRVGGSAWLGGVAFVIFPPPATTAAWV